eukprot:Pompholyxophrys_sp_v1_NODE_1_length_32789_cov_6.460653.p22 type:complete len:175 gc:universal NODE_1_length_32789_cov_6.460653:29950-30474(+)
MKVGIWLYRSNLIGYVEQNQNDQKLYTYLFNPSPMYHPSRSYWDDNEWVPSVLPDEIDRNHATEMGVTAVFHRLSHSSNRIAWWQHCFGLTYYEMNDGTEIYTTQFGITNDFYKYVGYRDWTYNDTLNMQRQRTQLATYDSYIDRLLPIILLLISWFGISIIVLAVFMIIYLLI